jgi:micrococcal nuclease
MYEYKASLVRVVDGDTCDLSISLGFHVTILQRCRLSGINAPEVRGENKVAGIAATEFVKSWFPSDGQVIIKSEKPYPDDKYGRFLVEIYRPTEVSATKSLNESLIVAGHAVLYG